MQCTSKLVCLLAEFSQYLSFCMHGIFRGTMMEAATIPNKGAGKVAAFCTFVGITIKSLSSRSMVRIDEYR